MGCKKHLTPICVTIKASQYLWLKKNHVKIGEPNRSIPNEKINGKNESEILRNEANPDLRR